MASCVVRNREPPHREVPADDAQVETRHPQAPHRHVPFHTVLYMVERYD